MHKKREMYIKVLWEKPPHHLEDVFANWRVTLK